MDGSFQSMASQAIEMDSGYIWDHLQEFFSENPQNFFRILSTLSDNRQGSSVKMFKAINLIKDEIVVVQELSIQREEQEKLMRLISFDQGQQQESEIRVSEKFLFSKSRETAVFWLEMEYCQMGTIHDIAHITKLAFSQGEIAFMLSQIFTYLIADRTKAEEQQHKKIRPLLDSKHIFLTNQGVLKLFPFPLFSQQIISQTTNCLSRNAAINADLIALIALMDNNKHGIEENYSEDLREVVNALRNNSTYESLLNESKIICENKSRFEYIKRSIYATRKRSIENYRKRSISQFVPDALKKVDSINPSSNVSSGSAHYKSKSTHNHQHKKVQGPSNIKADENILLSGDMNSFKSSHRIRNAASSALSQDLKDISQISFIQGNMFSLGSDAASLGSNVITSQLLNYSKYSFNTNNAVLSPRVDNILDSQTVPESNGISHQNNIVASNIPSEPIQQQQSQQQQSNQPNKMQPHQLGSLILQRFMENHPDKKKFKVRRYFRDNKQISDSSSISSSSQNNDNCSFSQIASSIPAPPALPITIIPSEIPEELSQEVTSTQSFIESPITLKNRIKPSQDETFNTIKAQQNENNVSIADHNSKKPKQPRYSPKTECQEMQQSSIHSNSRQSQEIQRTSIESASSISSCTSQSSSPRIIATANDLSSPKKQKRSTQPLLRSHSDEIEVFTLQEYMTHKRNSSPVSRMPGNKKTESPKVEKPSYSPSSSPMGIICPPTILTFDSASKREPFSIRRLLQKPLTDLPKQSEFNTPPSQRKTEESIIKQSQISQLRSSNQQYYKPIFSRDHTSSSQKPRQQSQTSIIMSTSEISGQQNNNNNSYLIGNSLNIIQVTNENTSFKEGDLTNQGTSRLKTITEGVSGASTTQIKPMFSLFPSFKHDFTFIRNNLFESSANSENQSFSTQHPKQPQQSQRIKLQQTDANECYQHHSENLPMFQSAEGTVNLAMPSQQNSSVQSTSSISFAVAEDKSQQQQQQQQTQITKQQRQSNVFVSVSSHHSRSNSPFSVSSTTTTSQHSRYPTTVTTSTVKQFAKFTASPLRTNQVISPFDSNKSSIQSPLSVNSSWSLQQQVQQSNQMQMIAQQQHQIKPPQLSPMRRKYGKDLTHRFNEQGQYIENPNQHSRRTSQLIFGSTIDMSDSFSTTDSNAKCLQVKGISLLAKQTSLNVQNNNNNPTASTISYQVPSYQPSNNSGYPLPSSLNFTDFCFP